jgi:hypothetical protein
MIDCIYVAASTHDARYTRICVASIRYFYPDIPIRLLVGGPLERGLTFELARYWNVAPADVAPGVYGWGFVKLEPLFVQSGERFLVLDSDTALSGRVLTHLSNANASFVVDDEQQSEDRQKMLYYDWTIASDLVPAVAKPRFVFNTGQWFGTGGLLERHDFTPWLRWTMPRTLIDRRQFKQGEQGVLNWVINRRVADGSLEVARRPLLVWPGHSMQGLTPEAIRNGTAQPRIIHWAGLKRLRLSDMIGADVLEFFERYYYSGMSRRARYASRYHQKRHRWEVGLGIRLNRFIRRS